MHDRQAVVAMTKTVEELQSQEEEINKKKKHRKRNWTL